MGKIRPLFVYFCSFHMTNIAEIDYNYGVLWTRTRDGRMVGADESTEQWRYPSAKLFILKQLLTLLKIDGEPSMICTIIQLSLWLVGVEVPEAMSYK